MGPGRLRAGDAGDPSPRWGGEISETLPRHPRMCLGPSGAVEPRDGRSAYAFGNSLPRPCPLVRPVFMRRRVECSGVTSRRFVLPPGPPYSLMAMVTSSGRERSMCGGSEVRDKPTIPCETIKRVPWREDVRWSRFQGAVKAVPAVLLPRSRGATSTIGVNARSWTCSGGNTGLSSTRALVRPRGGA